MLGIIIFAYPLSLIAGLILGAAIRRPIVGVLWSVIIGVALAVLLSLEYLSVIGLPRLLLEMIAPAAAFCAVLAIIGSAVSLGIKALVRTVGSRL